MCSGWVELRWGHCFLPPARLVAIVPLVPTTPLPERHSKGGRGGRIPALLRMGIMLFIRETGRERLVTKLQAKVMLLMPTYLEQGWAPGLISALTCVCRLSGF